MSDGAHGWSPRPAPVGFARVRDGAGLTYPGVGATWTGAPQAGFRGLRVSTRLGSGESVFGAAARTLMEWRLHRAMGVTVRADAERAAPGVRVTVGLGAGQLRVHGPCRVVWTVAEERRAGWAYGTLPGHPVSGEEAFLITREGRSGSGPRGGAVWLTVCAFSSPDTWWTRAAGPLVPLFQHGYARRCGLALRRMAQSGENGC